jgi:signal peptidase II
VKNEPGWTVPYGQTSLLFFIVALGTAADLWTKAAIFKWRGYPGQSPPWWLVDGHVGVETAVNIGAVFGLGAGQGALFAALSIFAAMGIFVWLFRYQAILSWYLTIALACVLGGIGGNLYDRLGLWYEPGIGLPPEWRSGVRDWILWQVNDRWRWPNFNIADSLLVTGAIMMILHSFWSPLPSDHNHRPPTDLNHDDA